MTTLADLGARTLSPDDVRQLFPDAWWHEVLFDWMRQPPPPIHFIEGDLAVDDLTAGAGPWALIVHGDLHATGDLDFATSDYKVSLLVVHGNVRARNFRFTNGASCVIAHDLVAHDYVVGRYGDESAQLVVGGTLRARALLLDHVTGVDATELDTIVCTTAGWRLPIDINYYDEQKGTFADAVLDEDGRIELFAAWDAATRGEPVLLPDAEARLRPPGPRPGPPHR